jgi:hypothetical protein
MTNLTLRCDIMDKKNPTVKINGMKYRAILVKHLRHWLWFETTKTEEKDGKFVGIDGWGKGGESTSITVQSDLIIGRVDSDVLDY